MRNTIFNHKITLSMICALIALCTSSNCWPTTYYVDATGGNDSNAGTATDSAWKTISKINRSSFVAGDNVLFKKGETWREQLTVPSSGSAGNPITFSSYGNGNKPILYGATIIAPNLWTNNNGVYFRNLVAYALWEDNVALKFASSPACTDGNWYYTDAPIVTYYKPTSGTPSDHTVETFDSTDPGIKINGKDYITVAGISFTKLFLGVGTRWESSTNVNNISVLNNSFSNNVFGVYLIIDHTTSSNIIIDNNTFEYNDEGMQFTGLNQESVNHSYDNITISNNTLIGTGYTSSDYKAFWIEATRYVYDDEAIGVANLKNSKIYGNNIQGKARGIYLYISGGGGLGEVYNNEIYNNYISTYDTGLILAGAGAAKSYYGNNIHNNIVKNSGLNPLYGYGVLINNVTSVTTAIHNTLYNNTIDGSAIGIRGVANNLYWRVKNNIITNNSSYNVDIGNSSGGVPNNFDFDYNLYSPDGASAFRIGDANKTFATWKQATGTPDTHSIIGNPLFVSSSDFYLTSSSPAINAGTTVGLKQDYVGKKNPVGSAPDIGAFEYQGVTSIPSPIPSSPSTLSVQ